MNAATTILVSLCLTGKILVGRANDYNSDDLLAILLNLHKLHCGEAAICHVTNGNGSHVEPTPAMFPRPCCVPCSCLSTCEAHRNCCPSDQRLWKASEFVTPSSLSDNATKPHRLQDAFNASIQPQQRDGDEMRGKTARRSKRSNRRNASESLETNMKSLAEELSSTRKTTIISAINKGTYPEHISHFKSNGIDHDYENDAVSRGVETACIRPQLFYRPNTHPDSDAYKMVISCPAELQDAILLEKCMKGQNNENIADVIPVTSKLSGLTYVNKYCLFCNELEQQSTLSFEEWQIQIIDENADYHHVPLLHPQSIRTLGYKHFFNVHFVRNNPSSMRKCNRYDIISCNQTGFWENYDETIEMVCRDGEDLPIIHTVNYNRMVFKNIACVHCNVPSGFSNGQLNCGYHYKVPIPNRRSRKTLTINYHSAGGFQTLDKEDISGSYIETSVLKVLKPGSCPKGFLAILDRCRRIVCPRDHYIEMGQCVPLYNILTGFDINFKLKITPVRDIKGNKAKIVVEKLKSTVNNSLENLVSLQSREVWVWFLPKGNKKDVGYYIFDIFLYNASNEIKHSQAVPELHSFFNSIKSLNTLQFSDGNKFEFRYGIGHGIELNRMGMFDLGAGKGGKLRSLSGDDWKQQIPNHDFLTISDINWCMRTEFTTDEIEELGFNMYRIKQTNTILFEGQWDYRIYLGSYILCTCITYIVDDTDTDNRYPAIQDIPRIVDDSEDDIAKPSLTFDMNDKGLASAIAGFVLFVIGIILFKAKSTFKKRQLHKAEDQTHVGIEISSFRDSTKDTQFGMSEISCKTRVLDNASSEASEAREVDGKKQN